MARIDKSVLGFVSGKLGDVVFRRMNGKKFVSAGAKKYKISQSEEAKKGRANFAVTVKFARTINSIPELKAAWSSAKIEGTNSYHRIIKHNSKLVNSGELTTTNKITPDGLPLTLSFLKLNDEKELEINIAFEKDKIKFPAVLYLVFALNNDMLLKQKVNIDAKDIGAILKISLDNEILKGLKKFPNAVIYAAVLGGKANTKEILWTSTAAGEI